MRPAFVIPSSVTPPLPGSVILSRRRERRLRGTRLPGCSYDSMCMVEVDRRVGGRGAGRFGRARRGSASRRQIGGPAGHSWQAGRAPAKFRNRLAKETSPYLLLHAHNPVDWYPWGEEALGGPSGNRS